MLQNIENETRSISVLTWVRAFILLFRVYVDGRRCRGCPLIPLVGVLPILAFISVFVGTAFSTNFLANLEENFPSACQLCQLESPHKSIIVKMSITYLDIVIVGSTWASKILTSASHKLYLFISLASMLSFAWEAIETSWLIIWSPTTVTNNTICQHFPEFLLNFCTFYGGFQGYWFWFTLYFAGKHDLSHWLAITTHNNDVTPLTCWSRDYRKFFRISCRRRLKSTNVNSFF